jgi:glutathione S-transferase
MSTNTSTTVVKTVTIHGEPDSVAVKRVLVVLAELGVPFALKFVSWADPKIKSEEYKSKMNPFGLIPVMVSLLRFVLVQDTVLIPCQYT